MPERNAVNTAPENPVDNGVKTMPTIQSSPLKLAVQAFLKSHKLEGVVNESSERSTKVNDVTVKTLYQTYKTDEDAYRVALAYLQNGESFGGSKDELFCSGFPKTNQGDSFILVFQTAERGPELPVDLGADVSARVKKFLAAENLTGATLFAGEVSKGQPVPVIAEFDTPINCAKAAFAFISSNEPDKDQSLQCLGEIGNDKELVFYAME